VHLGYAMFFFVSVYKTERTKENVVIRLGGLGQVVSL
jgi:hypothetical protein